MVQQNKHQNNRKNYDFDPFDSENYLRMQIFSVQICTKSILIHIGAANSKFSLFFIYFLKTFFGFVFVSRLKRPCIHISINAS